MRPALALAVVLPLAFGGCTPRFIVEDFLAGGLVRPEPHPTIPGAFRVTWFTTPGLTPVHSVNIHTAEGRQAALPLFLGERCANGQMIEENRMELPPDLIARRRELVVTRVVCG
jgi:hypothetical protein